MLCRRSLIVEATLTSLILAACALHVPTAHSHSGGLDSNGCHAGSQPYHCHRAPSDMVGNRLRCDLGSESEECVGESTSGQMGQSPYEEAAPSVSGPNDPSPSSSSSPDGKSLVCDADFQMHSSDGVTPLSNMTAIWFGEHVLRTRKVARLDNTYQIMPTKTFGYTANVGTIEWGGMSLDRKTLELTSRGPTLQCELVSEPSMALDALVAEVDRLKALMPEKMNGNKI